MATLYHFNQPYLRIFLASIETLFIIFLSYAIWKLKKKEREQIDKFTVASYLVMVIRVIVIIVNSIMALYFYLINVHYGKTYIYLTMITEYFPICLISIGLYINIARWIYLILLIKTSKPISKKQRLVILSLMSFFIVTSVSVYTLWICNYIRKYEYAEPFFMSNAVLVFLRVALDFIPLSFYIYTWWFMYSRLASIINTSRG